MIEWLSNTFDLRFYYWTGLNWIILFPTYVIGAGLIASLWWWLAKRMRRAWVVIAPLVAVLIIAPWVEELWIAWNFGRLCKKDAGIFIHKVVEVEGFYYGGGGPFELIRSGQYQWLEGPDRDGKGHTRMTLGDAEFLRLAKERLKKGEGKAAGEGISRVQIDERTEALVFVQKDEVWRITKLDHPTARYHYTTGASHLSVTHGVKKFDDVVADSDAKDVLGRYTNYYRSAPWFFIGFDRPTIPCEETEEATRRYGALMIYALTLRPKTRTDNVGERK